MAIIETTRPVAGTGIAAVFAPMFAAIIDWNDARVTRKALSRLSSRELDDIGLCRGDIESIATRGARR